MQFIRLRSGHSSRLLLCVYLFWRLGKCRRAISSRESRSTRARGWRIDSAVWLAPPWVAGEIDFPRRHHSGILFVILGFLSSLQGGPIFGGIRMIHFFSIALIGFFGRRWDNG